MAGPLDGVRVIDLSTVMYGPYCTMILGEMGADIIKVEPPSGDITRQVGESRTPGMASGFLGKGRNKRSLALDLKQAAAREALYKFVATADVFIHNIRPRAAARDPRLERRSVAPPRALAPAWSFPGAPPPYPGCARR